MKNSVQLFLGLALIAGLSTSCKSKQKITEIPAGSNIKATTPKTTTAPVTTATTTAPVAQKEVSNEPEQTRNENFSLAEGETNGDAMKMKYHVVVGSFGKQMNAKNLQSSLNNEGNKAVVVVNEAGMFRVLIASFNDYNEAHAKIKQIATRFPGSWVLVKK